MFIVLYTSIGAAVFPYILVKNIQVIKPTHSPLLFALWSLALPLTYTDNLSGMIKELETKEFQNSKKKA